MTSLQYLPNFAFILVNLFNVHEIQGICSALIKCSPEKFKKKLINKCLKKAAVFVKEALEIVTKLDIEFHPDECIFVFFKIT